MYALPDDVAQMRQRQDVVTGEQPQAVRALEPTALLDLFVNVR